MMSDLARPNETPIRREERALGAWLKTIKASKDFDTGWRADKEDGYGFQTIWYHGVGERGRAGAAPFSLPGASRESWMSGHVPFIYRRAHISAPPRKIVFTDDGELGADGTRSGRPLRFLDHGSELHDALVSGYTGSVLSAFGTAKPVVQTSVRLPEGHPARGLGPLVVVTVAQFDPFPDELLPPAWTTEARQLLNSAPTDVQKSALSADRRMLHTLLRAFQRRLRVAAPAVFMRKGYWKAKDGLALSLVNRRQLRGGDFRQMEGGAVLLTDNARKLVLTAWQERKKEERLHPFVAEKAPFGLVPYLQAQMLARHLRGDIDAYPPWFWS